MGMSKRALNKFNEWKATLGDNELEMLNGYFKDFHQRCLISKSDVRKIREDIEKTILYYIENGFSLDEALKLLDPTNFGGFYARPSLLWFPLDDSAKIYPMSLEHDSMPVFRLSAYMKSDVVKEILQMALTFTIKRFPSFATTLKKGVFWHYLDTTKRRFVVSEENDIPCRPLKVGRSGSQSFRVIYYKNRISVEFFHVLTDGTGGMVFLKALISEYVRLLGADIKELGSIWNVNDTPEIEETTNEFSNRVHSEATSGLINKRVLQMNGRLTKVKPNQIIHFNVNSDKLKEVAKKYNATVTSYILALMFIAIKKATDSLSGDVSIQVPVNMRKFYPSKTVRNFAMYCGVKLDIADIKTVDDLVTIISEQLKEKASKEKMSEMVTSANKLVRSIKLIPLFIKLPIAKKLYGFLGDQAFTSTLSNLGVVDMPEEYKNYVSSMDFVLGTAPNNRAIIGMVTYNETTTISISKMTKDPTFEEKLYELLLKDELEVVVEGCGMCEN